MADDKSLEENLFPPVVAAPETADITKLVTFFQDKFHSKPEFIARAPGRVNLIGEHIDYCGFSVCPMAIQQHILIAVKARDDETITLANVEDSYADYEGSVSNISITVNGTPAWYQYFLCGLQGILDNLPEGTTPRGFQAAVYGTIPPRSGLSSSSALVCAAALASSRVFGLTMKKHLLAVISAQSERYIGTQGGGMDQAIAFLATQGCAKIISFNPLTADDLPLPEGTVVVIANSMAEMNKAATADFNRRVVECRLGAHLFSHRVLRNWKAYNKLSELQKKLQSGVRHMRALARETVQTTPFTKDQLCKEFQIKAEELEAVVLTENTKDINQFKIYERLMHVTQEAERVQEFTRHCKLAHSGAAKPEDSLWHLGKIMKESHESLKTLYECSHQQLDEIVAIAAKYTKGGRLTGAGWGGCTVAVATEEAAKKYIQVLKEEFYAKCPAAVDRDLDTLVFSTQPGPGAAIYLLD